MFRPDPERSDVARWRHARRLDHEHDGLLRRARAVDEAARHAVIEVATRRDGLAALEVEEEAPLEHEKNFVLPVVLVPWYSPFRMPSRTTEC